MKLKQKTNGTKKNAAEMMMKPKWKSNNETKVKGSWNDNDKNEMQRKKWNLNGMKMKR